MKILQMIGSVAIATSIATVAAIVSPVTANAATFGFQNIIGGDNISGDTIVGQFKFDVTDVTDGAAGRTLWTFSNSTTTTSSASFISQIYFDWRSTASELSVNAFNSGNVGTVDFGSSFSGPDKLPQRTSIDFVTQLAIGSLSQGSGNGGIDLDEKLGVIFNSSSASVIEAAINSGDLRVGIHVQGIAVAGGRSDAYFSLPNTPTKPVPVPGFLLGVMAAGALGSTRLLKKKQAA